MELRGSKYTQQSNFFFSANSESSLSVLKMLKTKMRLATQDNWLNLESLVCASIYNYQNMDRHFSRKLRFIFMMTGQDFIMNGRDFHDDRLRFYNERSRFL